MQLRDVHTVCDGHFRGLERGKALTSWPGRKVPGRTVAGPEGLGATASSCSQKRRTGQEPSRGRGSKGSALCPLPTFPSQRLRATMGLDRPGLAWRPLLPPTPGGTSVGNSGGNLLQRDLLGLLQPRLKEARELRASRRLLLGACHDSHTLLGDKAPGPAAGTWEPCARASASVGRQSRKPHSPSCRTLSPAYVPARNKPMLSFFSETRFLELTPSWVCYFYPP